MTVVQITERKKNRVVFILLIKAGVQKTSHHIVEGRTAEVTTRRTTVHASTRCKANSFAGSEAICEPVRYSNCRVHVILKVFSMPVARVITQLFEDGRLILESDQPPSEKELLAAEDVVCDFERTFRETFAPEPPIADHAVIRWSLERFYWAAQRIAYQHLDQTWNEKDSSPPAMTPESCYSVDIVFRFLPDLVRLSRSSETNSQLTETLQRWARDWPFSSVGIALSEEVNIDGFLSHPSLRMMYIDRVIATGDASRLDNELVLESVKAAIGANPQLAPTLHELIQQKEQTDA